MKYTHLFFDMDLTIAPAREPMLDEMYELLTNLPQDIVIVSGSLVEQIKYQSRDLKAHYLGVNGNHATDEENTELWKYPDLSDAHKQEIHSHIKSIIEHLDHELNEQWHPIEDRGSQITFSPIGNQAPLAIKKAYDPDRTKREAMLVAHPLLSDEILVKIGGSTSFDYIHKDRHKGANVAKLIELKGWNKDDCVYFGDGLYPGGNDESVIGVIETVLVRDHLDTYEKLKAML
jgi:hypothetical protein